VEARVFDLELLARLEEARLEGTAVKDGHFDEGLADRRYGEIFREFHLDVDAGSAEEVGRRMGDSTVALEVASLLDGWAMLRRELTARDEARWQRLLGVARAADPDAWRGHLREALAEKDGDALVSLASADEAAHLLPWTSLALAQALRRARAVQPAE